jgi:hypothetical protein
MKQLRESILGLIDRFDREDKYKLARELASLIELPAGVNALKRVTQMIGEDLSEKECFRVQVLGQIIEDTGVDTLGVDNEPGTKMAGDR